MRTVTSVGEFKRELAKSPKNMRKAARWLAVDIRDAFISQARVLAPHRTGELKSSIYYKRHQRTGWVITSEKMRGGFPVSVFTDKRFPITIKRWNPYFRINQTFRYGDSAVSPSGKPINWTGQRPVGWWTHTERLIEKRYPPRLIKKYILDYVRSMN